MDKLTKQDGSSPDIVAENVERLRELFPEVFADGSINFDALKETLGEYVNDREERYSFNWHGKSKARQIAQMPSAGTLRPCPDESVNWGSTKNIFIEGDNLEVLKLLQKSYHRKVKMIYIDPPYNTGKEFIYPDRYQDNLDTYLKYTGQVDDEGFKLSANSETSGRYHTNWLNMMYPRLKLARNLLREDGAIFISIDHREVKNLRAICDEVFGEENFVVPVIWQKRVTPENRKAFSYEHDYILCYARSAEVFGETRRLLPLTDEARARYRNPDNDPRGDWLSVPAVAQAGHGTKAQFYTLETPDGRFLPPPAGNCWRYSQERMLSEIADNRIWFGRDGTGVPRIKRFLSETRQGITPSTMWFASDVGANEHAKKRLKKLFGGKVVFDNPKPIGVIQRMLQITTEPNGNDIILDFFGGSGTTGHAVMEQNSHDGGNRRFILVQLPEPTDEGEFDSIAEIAKARLRRSAADIADRSSSEIGCHAGDTAFMAFRLSSSNVNPWDAEFDTIETDLVESIDHIKSDRSEPDVLFELLLKYGLDLAIPIENRRIEDRNVYVIGAGALVVCLADDVVLDVVKGIAELKVELKPAVMRVVFKDSGFASDVIKTNAAQILKQAGVDDVKSL